MRKVAVFTIIVSILAIFVASCGGSSNDSSNSGSNDGNGNLPTISEISTSNITTTNIVITWTTNEDSTSQVEYGTSKSYGSSSNLDNTLVTSHSVILSGLDANTTYHYRVKSKDADGNEKISGDNNFITAESSSASAQWAAYDFNKKISPATGASGNIKSFTIEETNTNEGNTGKYKIDGEYLGISKNTDIKTQKMDMNTFETTIVTTSIECYQIKHHITVLQAPPGEDNPDWADVTIWIPTTKLETSAMYFWIYPMATYVDSDGRTGEWGYYLTEAMQSEMDQETAMYLPYTEGDFYGYDQSTLFGLYGWAWMWFSQYAVGGNEHLEEGSWNSGFGGMNYTYSVDSGKKTIGSYIFDDWSVAIAWNYGGQTAEYKGIFSPDLPLPIYLKIGSNGGGSQNYFEYELTNLVLK